MVGAALGMTTALAACGGGGDFPSDDIEYVIPYNPGGSTDPMGREFAELLSDSLGVSNVPQNMPGGDESIGISHVADAEPDGYTLGLASTAGLLAQPLLNEDLQYQGAEDFTPLVKMSDTPYALFVAEDSPYETLDDLLDAAAEDPGGVRIGTANRMGNTGFVLYALEDQAEVSFTIVPSTGGSGESALEVMGGRLEALIATASGQAGMVESGDLRALAYTGSDYEQYLPEAVPFDEAGYEIPFTADYMTLAPADLPEDVTGTLVESAVEVAESEEWADYADTQGIIPQAIHGEELDQLLQDQQAAIEEAIELAENRND